MINTTALKTLEFDKVLTLLSNRTQSELGRQLATSLTPLTDLDEINHLLQETTELKTLLAPARSLSLSGISDLTSILNKIGDWQTILTPKEIQRVADIIRAARDVKSIFKENKDLSLITKIEEQIPDFSEIEALIDRVLEPNGTIKNTASGKLKSSRKKIEILKKRIRDKITSFGKSSGLELFLQDSNVRETGDRSTVAVMAKHAAKVNGIKRGQSDSGKTVFIEPEEIKLLGDDLELEKFEENLEEQRLLGEITSLISDRKGVLLKTVAILSHLDLTYAKVRLSREFEMCAPLMNKEGVINLQQATHPLLRAIAKEEKPPTQITPIDVSLGKAFTTLIVTGPNTGGKTISLKTIGLLSLMAQSGLHVPVAQGSQLSVFKNIWADIGDEQSIEQSLSTFSSHLLAISEILKTADHQSLVMLDELGGGTDPAEGAALAKSILTYLHQKKVRVAVSTHISQLKTLGYTVEGMENASIEFDTETLKPTYRLLLGLPGESNALSLARRLGLPEEVLKRAEAFSEDEESTQLIHHLQDARNSITKDQMAAKEAKLKQQEILEKTDQTLKMLNIQLDAAKEKSGEKSLEALKVLGSEIEMILKEKSSKRSLISSFEQLKEKIDLELNRTIEKTSEKRAIQTGDRVRIPSLKQVGNVTDISSNNTAVIALGGLTMTLPLTDVERIEI